MSTRVILSNLFFNASARPGWVAEALLKGPLHVQVTVGVDGTLLRVSRMVGYPNENELRSVLNNLPLAVSVDDIIRLEQYRKVRSGNNFQYGIEVDLPIQAVARS